MFIDNRVVDSSFYDLSDTEKAIEWVEEQRLKHGAKND